VRYVIIKYIRLSLDEEKTGSMSIENQRLIIDRYIAEMDIEDAEVLEFVDNGHSGTNFERPAIQEVLSLVSSGAVNCIIVKDFSRLGRNEIETANYIERVFPLYRTRFISVTDSFDSDKHIGDTGGLEVAFKFLINGYYSKDLSIKIKSARHTKMRRGESLTKNCLFGFVKVGKHLQIDESAADTVRLIFNLASAGYGEAEIRRRLFNLNRPTPSEHKKRTPEPRCIWGSGFLRDMLSNEQYVGTYIAGKSEIKIVGSQKAVAKDESEWIRIPNHHPAIISSEQFSAVQTMLGKRKKAYTANWQPRDYILRRKVFCGCCGHALELSNTSNPAFSCQFTKIDSTSDCHGLSIRKNVLEEMLHSMVSDWAKSVLDNNVCVSSPLPNLDEQIVAVQDEKLNLYERLVSGELDLDAYKIEKATLNAELEQRNAILIAVSAQANQAAAHTKLSALAESILKSDSLMREAVNALIERVYVFPDQHIEVVWTAAVVS
jgi:DNA invertase Pin-like site-specific DNA recombinase